MAQQPHPHQPSLPASSPAAAPPEPQGQKSGSKKPPRRPMQIDDPGPVKERVGQLRGYPGDPRSKFEDMPGQQIPGEPGAPGHAKDYQHLRGRVVSEGSGAEDKDPKPKGVPKGAIQPGKQGTEEPDAPPLPEPEPENPAAA